MAQAVMAQQYAKLFRKNLKNRKETLWLANLSQVYLLFVIFLSRFSSKEIKMLYMAFLPILPHINQKNVSSPGSSCDFYDQEEIWVLTPL